MYEDKMSNQGLRIEAPSLMKEFTDHTQFGTDPEGLLFYHTDTDFDMDGLGDIKYKVFWNDETPRVVRIDFLPPREGSTRFASFISRDTGKLGDDFYWQWSPTSSGQWQPAERTTSAAWLRKITGAGNTVALTIDSIHKSAVFTVPDETAIAISGTFYFKDLCDLDGECVADYDADRLLFYPKKDLDKLIGVFFPKANGPGIPIDDQGIDQWIPPTPPIANWLGGKAILDNNGGFKIQT